MKNKKISLFLKASLGILGTATILGGVGTTLVSCVTNDATTSNYSIVKYYNSFLNNTHGRWAGNLSNYGEDQLKSEKINAKYGNAVWEGVDAYIGFREGITPTPIYNLNTKIESNHVNYSSYHAKEWLVDQLTNKIGFELKEETSFPQDVEKTKLENIDISDDVQQATIDTNDTTSVNSMLETGVLVQSFLWHGMNRMDGGKISYNNRGQNIIATVVGTKSTSSESGLTKDKKMKDFYIAAHYDSIADGPDKASWGAIDNGSGVACLLAIAEYFLKNPDQLNDDIRLHILFAGAEEVGICGTWAFAKQYLNYTTASEANRATVTSLNNVGMINLDTIAGGDYIYVHSPNTDENIDPLNKKTITKSTTSITPNTSTTIRDQVNALSRIRAVNMNDMNQELLIHPYISFSGTVSGNYRAGEVTDSSDHVPFYKSGIPIAYFESGNFQVKSLTGSYDGLARTIDPNAYVLKDGTTLASKGLSLKTTNYLNTGFKVYEVPDEYSNYDDYEVAGEILHTDLDTLAWTNKHFANKIKKQLVTMFETLKLYIKTSI